MGWWNNNQWFWNREWRRTFFEWEVGEERQLKQLFENKSLMKERKESWIWKEDEKHEYSVKFAYRIM